MASFKDIKSRTKSVKATKKIARAMEMVAAARMKKAQKYATQNRPYIDRIAEMIANLVYTTKEHISHPYITPAKKRENIMVLVITANRGLCGPFNSNLVRASLTFVKNHKDLKRFMVTIGKKGRNAMERINENIMADFSHLAEQPTYYDMLGITGIIEQEFLSGKVDEVYAIYTDFRTTLTQIVTVKKILPFEVSSEFKPANERVPYIIEGDRDLFLDSLLKRYLSSTVYQLVLDSKASEFSARMMAMSQASQNADDISRNLQLAYNKMRQEKITKEILEVIGGSVVAE